MVDRTLFLLTFAAAIGSGIVAGMFYAFSSFVMAALARLPASQGVAAMNAINVTVITPSFMAFFLGTAVACVALATGSYVWSQGGWKLLLAASLIYLVGCFGVTMLGNVPLNDQLAVVTPAQEAALWTRYLKDWTLWNHVRTAASLLAAILFTLALVVN